ncbi:RNA polymerase sigma factor [Solicola gregarius]|uniref:RNA polymerase sigma factor n=1 Tax=Solicola gregarius TaxID=2908642 RepID=A0AA46YN52_9ACTN|nr:RNA polymerase sigma factor [Solicola gregarius]UYM07244.1 RNA polymerase sigma factor [Solicola gregarius]
MTEPFEQIVAEHGPTVLRVARAVLGPDDADDAWTETFIAAMRAYPDLPEGSNVEAWLVTIAKRKAIDQHRTRTRNPVPVEVLPVADSAELSATDPDPAERDDELWGALAGLPRKQREAIAYHYVVGMPYAEIATLLGNTESAARRAAADGMKTLRATYARERRDLEQGASS